MGPFALDWTKADAERVIARGDPSELLYVPIVVGMNAADCEPGWSESVCMRLIEHPNFNVRGNALLGLGHIARTCRVLDLAAAGPVISRALRDEHPYVRGHANSAAEDVLTYLGFEVPGFASEHDHEV